MQRALRVLVSVLYWVAVLAISIVLLVLLVRFFEARDDSGLDESRTRPPAVAVS